MSDRTAIIDHYMRGATDREAMLVSALRELLADVGPCDTSRDGWHSNATGVRRTAGATCSACAARALVCP